MFKRTSKFWDILGEILAIVFIITFAFMIVNANFNFISNPTILTIFGIVKNYGALLIAGVVGLKTIAKRNIVFQVIFLVFIGIIVIFLFFPGTYANLIGLIPSTSKG